MTPSFFVSVASFRADRWALPQLGSFNMMGLKDFIASPLA
jgi:hypothetical protein